jgi:hypothetical protein
MALFIIASVGVLIAQSGSAGYCCFWRQPITLGLQFVAKDKRGENRGNA